MDFFCLCLRSTRLALSCLYIYICMYTHIYYKIYKVIVCLVLSCLVCLSYLSCFLSCLVLSCSWLVFIFVLYFVCLMLFVLFCFDFFSFGSASFSFWFVFVLCCLFYFFILNFFVLFCFVLICFCFGFVVVLFLVFVFLVLFCFVFLVLLWFCFLVFYTAPYYDCIHMSTQWLEYPMCPTLTPPGGDGREGGATCYTTASPVTTPGESEQIYTGQVWTCLWLYLPCLVEFDYIILSDLSPPPLSGAVARTKG